MNIFDEYIEQLIELIQDAMLDGDYKQALKLLNSGLLEEPGYPKLHYEMAYLHQYYLLNNYMVERHYNLAIYFDEKYKDAYEGLCRFYQDQKEHTKLKALMNKARKSEAIEKNRIMQMLGYVAEMEEEYSDAIRFYRKALMVSMDNDETKDLKQTIKRTRFKNLKRKLKWLPQS